MDLNEQTGVMELGYCLSRAFQGRGLMTEALRAVLRCLFENTSVRVTGITGSAAEVLVTIDGESREMEVQSYGDV